MGLGLNDDKYSRIIVRPSRSLIYLTWLTYNMSEKIAESEERGWLQRRCLVLRTVEGKNCEILQIGSFKILVHISSSTTLTHHRQGTRLPTFAALIETGQQTPTFTERFPTGVDI